MSQDSIVFAQIIQLVVLQPDLMAYNTLSSLIPMNVCPALRLVLSLTFVNVYLIIMERQCGLGKGKLVKVTYHCVLPESEGCLQQPCDLNLHGHLMWCVPLGH